MEKHGQGEESEAEGRGQRGPGRRGVVREVPGAGPRLRSVVRGGAEGGARGGARAEPWMEGRGLRGAIGGALAKGRGLGGAGAGPQTGVWRGEEPGAGLWL